MTGLLKKRFAAAMLVLLVTVVIAGAQSGAGGVADLMNRRLYDHAIRILKTEIEGRTDAENAVSFLRLGECYYLKGMYNEARPWYAKALQVLPPGRNQIIAEYRLACLAYRISDAAGAIRQTEEFVRRHPGDQRAGRLLLFKMQLLATQGAAALEQIEATRREIAGRARVYGASIDLSADKILTDYYLSIGQGEKAVEGYLAIWNNYRKVSAEYAADNRPVPAALRESRDFAALQLALIAVNSNNPTEAEKWLESIDFDPQSIWQARLMLAQIAYGQGDYRKAERTLLDNGFIETVPEGEIRSNMYLLLGFCAKTAVRPTYESVAEYFGKVTPGTRAYAQAQMGLGDTAERWRRYREAIVCFENARVSAAYEPEALARLGRLYLEKAAATDDEDERNDFYEKSADRFSVLTTKYSSTRFARDADEQIRSLIAKGYDVKLAMSDAELIAEWEATVSRHPGSQEAARALISIARLAQSAVRNEETDELIKPPDFATSAAAATRLLDPLVYTGRDLAPEFWRDLRAEAHYYRGLAHTASLGRQTESGDYQPVYLDAPSVQQALEDLAQARELAGEKQHDLLRNIELVMLEARFKSGDETLRKQAEDRFDELIDEYGAEPRFQRLALDLAEWHLEQGNDVEAARLYKGVAERGGAMFSQEDIVRLLFTAGRLYSSAGQDALAGGTERHYAVYIFPRAVIATAPFIAAWPPLQEHVIVNWPSDAGGVPAAEMLQILSRASGIPFVWSRRRGYNGLAEYLAGRRVGIEESHGTVASFLRRIIDPEKHGAALDIGLTGAEPTLAPHEREAYSPETRDRGQVVELFSIAEERRRYEPLTRPYGDWRRVHSGNTMFFSVLRRIEELTGTAALWADTVNRERTLATEYPAPPDGIGGNASCADVLSVLLEPLGLDWRIEPRDLSHEYFENALDCFNTIRQISPRSPYGEKSWFILALNYYHQRDYERMRIILEEYLRVFDSPSYEHFHQANFWIGWLFENERNYRDAARFYNRAAEEALVICRPAVTEEETQPFPSREQLAAGLAYETRFALDERVSATLTNITLEGRFIDFVRFNSNLEIRIDPEAAGVTAAIDLPPYENAPLFEVLCDGVERFGLSFKAENARPEVAERAYYRLALCYRRDELNEQALSAARVLIERYPQTARRRDTIRLKLDIYKALKDYRNVLLTLRMLQDEMPDETERYKLEYELARIHFDLCNYDSAVRHFRNTLAATQADDERVKVREGYARALLRAGSLSEALNQYRALQREETLPLRNFIAEMTVWYLERVTGAVSDEALPAAASKIIREYEALDPERRSNLTRDALARVTWIYYVSGLLDLHNGDRVKALTKFEAAGNSPDDSLAAEALYQAALLQKGMQHYAAARETLQYMLFSTRSAEAEVKGLHLLADCFRQLNDIEQAESREDLLLNRFPDSRLAEKVLSARRKAAADAAVDADDALSETAGGGDDEMPGASAQAVE